MKALTFIITLVIILFTFSAVVSLFKKGEHRIAFGYLSACTFLLSEIMKHI